MHCASCENMNKFMNIFILIVFISFQFFHLKIALQRMIVIETESKNDHKVIYILFPHYII